MATLYHVQRNGSFDDGSPFENIFGSKAEALSTAKAWHKRWADEVVVTKVETANLGIRDLAVSLFRHSVDWRGEQEVILHIPVDEARALKSTSATELNSDSAEATISDAAASLDPDSAPSPKSGFFLPDLDDED